jgi:glycerol uptake facilitator protein
MAKQPTLTQKLGAEVLGTALLTLIGAGSVTATVTLDGSVPFSEAQLGVISFAFAFIIMAMVYTIGKVSGCQINPAISVALSLTGRQSWADTVMYVVAQFVGGILGALGIVALFGTGAATGAGLGITHFADSTPVIQAVFAEAIGTFILVFTVYGIAVDPRAPAGWAGLVIGLIVAGIIFVVGPVTGASLNPARSFGPVLIQVLFGGKSYFDQYWVYIVGPVVGAALGAFAYDFLASPKAAAAAEAPASAEAEKVKA